jgi:hypothetical protein
MISECVMVWQFNSAPVELRSIHAGLAEPEWLVLIPASLCASEIEDRINSQGARDLRRYTTASGDIVYTGSSNLEMGCRSPREERLAPIPAPRP